MQTSIDMLLKDLFLEGFWGEIKIKVKQGKPLLIEVTRTTLIGDKKTSRKNRRASEHIPTDNAYESSCSTAEDM